MRRRYIAVEMSTTSLLQRDDSVMSDYVAVRSDARIFKRISRAVETNPFEYLFSDCNSVYDFSKLQFEAVRGILRNWRSQDLKFLRFEDQKTWRVQNMKILNLLIPKLEIPKLGYPKNRRSQNLRNSKLGDPRI